MVFSLHSSLTVACSLDHLPPRQGASFPENGEILDSDDEEDDEDGSPTSG